MRIPSSAAKGTQMLAKHVKETPNITNVRIYIEQAIGRMKVFQILKLQQSILFLPIIKKCVTCMCSINKLKETIGMLKCTEKKLHAFFISNPFFQLSLTVA